VSAPEPGFLARAAIGLWLCGIGALGFLQFWLRALRGGNPQVETIAWLWLAGAIVVTAIGIVLVVRARRPRPR